MGSCGPVRPAHMLGPLGGYPTYGGSISPCPSSSVQGGCVRISFLTLSVCSAEAEVGCFFWIGSVVFRDMFCVFVFFVSVRCWCEVKGLYR